MLPALPIPPPLPTPPPVTTPPLVHLQGIAKRYGALEALRGLDLTVAPGQVYGFLGRNGAGKSTALRIIMGITRPSAGTIHLFGAPVRGDEPAVRRRIGYVAQEQTFYGWMTPQRLGQFVAGFYPSWDDGEYRRLLRQLELPLDRRIQTFSGGMHAKLALALALAHRPELLVLDEPTAGMDAVARREFLDLVRAQAQRAGRTTLFSSHLIDEVELAADTIGILEGGRMIWEGPADALTAQIRRLRLLGPDAAVRPLPGALLRLLPAGLRLIEDRSDGDRRTVMVRATSPELLAMLESELLVAEDTGAWQLDAPDLEDVFVALVRLPLSD